MSKNVISISVGVTNASPDGLSCASRNEANAAKGKTIASTDIELLLVPSSYILEHYRPLENHNPIAQIRYEHHAPAILPQEG